MESGFFGVDRIYVLMKSNGEFFIFGVENYRVCKVIKSFNQDFIFFSIFEIFFLGVRFIREFRQGRNWGGVCVFEIGG